MNPGTIRKKMGGEKEASSSRSHTWEEGGKKKERRGTIRMSGPTLVSFQEVTKGEGPDNVLKEGEGLLRTKRKKALSCF